MTRTRTRRRGRSSMDGLGSPSERAPASAQNGDVPPAASAPGIDAEPYASGLRQLAKTVSSIGAPTALFTSLFYYFGLNHASYFFEYFGVSSDILGLSSGYYLLLSVDALMIPMTVVAFAGLVALWGHALLRARLTTPSRLRVVRVLLPVMAGAGLLLTAGGFSSVFTATILSRYLTAAPLSLACGVLLLAYADLLWHRDVRRPEGARAPGRSGSAGRWTIVFVLVGVSLFWAATDYSSASGTSRARRFAAQLPTYPVAVVYSERSLSLTAPGVRETPCRDAKAAYRFRYDGLVLVLRTGDQYLFLPRAWTPASGAAILMPRDGSLRLEFVRPTAGREPQLPAC